MSPSSHPSPKYPSRFCGTGAFVAIGLGVAFATGVFAAPLIDDAIAMARSVAQSAKYEYQGWTDKLHLNRSNKWFVGYLRLNNAYPTSDPSKFIVEGEIDWAKVARYYDVVTFGQYHKDAASYEYVKSQLPAMSKAGFRVFLQEAPPDVISSAPLQDLLPPLEASYPTAGREIHGVLVVAHKEGMRYGGFDVSRPSLSSKSGPGENPAALDASRNVGMANYIQNWDAANYRSDRTSSGLKFVTLNGADHTGHNEPGGSSTLNDALAGLGYRSFAVDVVHPRHVWWTQRNAGQTPTGFDPNATGAYVIPGDNDKYPVALPSSGASDVVVLCGPLRPR